MVGRALRHAAAARTPPRLLVTASRLAHGETGPQRWVSRGLGHRPAADAVQVQSFSAVQTQRQNQLAVRATLDRAGVPYTAPEPAAGHRPVVQVAAEHAVAARAALREQPSDGSDEGLPPGVHVVALSTRQLRVFTRQAAGDLVLAGPELGCDVRLGRADAEPEAGLPFPVDVVYTWVDGSDPDWLARKEAAWAAWSGRPDGPELHQLAANPSRFASREELRYSLRSLEMYAGWARRVFLVTDRQVPDWLRADHPQLTVVDHSEIFPADGSGRPTFNSHAIEARLHHIPGLAEHYLYLNDDVFFGRPVVPELFFQASGESRYFPTPSGLGPEPASASDRPVDAAAKVSRSLVEQAFGQAVSLKFQHVAHAQRRDVQAELESRFAAEVEATVRTPFRSPGDVSAAASLAHYYGSVTGRAVPGGLSYVYCDIADRRAPIKLTRLARERNADMFCLNDVGTDGEVGDAHDRALGPAAHDPDQLVRDFLTAYFPLPSGFERVPG